MFRDLLLIDDEVGVLPNAPFPDIVNPGDKPWTKRPSVPEASHVDFATREICAPPGDDHLSAIIRTHEMAHAAFTVPYDQYTEEEKQLVVEVHPTAYQIAEDFLITRKMRDIGDLPVPCTCDVCKAEMASMQRILAKGVLKMADNPIEAAQVWIGIKMDLPDSVAVFTYANEVSAICDIGVDSIPSQSARLQIAEILTSMINAPVVKSSKLIRALPMEGAPDWLIPTMEYPPLTAQREVRSYTINASDTGAIPRYIHRLPIDKQVFGSRKRKEAATVLIDMSASMQLKPEDLQQLVERFPAGRVVGYSGRYMHMLAENGRMVTDIPLGSSNECDGPALEWLASQRGRRYWVSDGQVTERGDMVTSRAMADALRIVRQGGIVWVRDFGKFLDGGNK